MQSLTLCSTELKVLLNVIDYFNIKVSENGKEEVEDFINNVLEFNTLTYLERKLTKMQEKENC